MYSCLMAAALITCHGCREKKSPDMAADEKVLVENGKEEMQLKMD
jgi:hypothetical protein